MNDMWFLALLGQAKDGPVAPWSVLKRLMAEKQTVTEALDHSQRRGLRYNAMAMVHALPAPAASSLVPLIGCLSMAPLCCCYCY